MTNVVDFPGGDKKVPLDEWFESIVERVEDEPLEAAIVVLSSESGEMIVYIKDPMFKDKYVGLMEMAKFEGMFESVSK